MQTGHFCAGVLGDMQYTLLQVSFHVTQMFYFARYYLYGVQQGGSNLMRSDYSRTSMARTQMAYLPRLF